MQDNKGKVYIVGAGPGDWELITLKGLKRLKEAEVVLYDHLSSRDLLRFIRPDAEVVCVGKQDGLHLFEQARINKLLYKEASEGKQVVRLKGGDPFIFSRGIDEALYLKKRGIEFEVIPGITSAFAAAESFGIPLTKKGKISSVAVLTGRKSNGDMLDAPDCDTLVYLMGVATARKVVSALISSGRPGATPCAFIERATQENERIVAGRLDNIINRITKEHIRPPAVFIVGKAVNYGRKIRGEKFKS